jgi:thiol-disulfide isomerase/thioredoxin
MTAPTSPSGSNKAFALIVAVVVVLGLAAIAVLATQRDSAFDDEIEATAEVEISGESLDAMPDGVTLTTPDVDAAIGQEAPELIGTNFQGEEVAITADGRPKAVYFMAHWCSHCQAELPALKELMDTGGLPDGVDVYTVSTAIDETLPNFPPYLWFDEEEFEGPVLRDDADSSAYVSYGGGGLPYAVYLDADNRVISRSSGELPSETISALWQQLALSVGVEGTGDESVDDDAADDDAADDDAAEDGAAEDEDGAAEDGDTEGEGGAAEGEETGE